MTVTSETYRKTLDDFLDDVGRMGDAATSVLLYGSMVRGDVRPGLSDVMDAVVFLRPKVFEERERYMRALEIMVEAAERLAHSGIPYHPFFYWDRFDAVSAMSLPSFCSERDSKVVWGAQIQPFFDSTEASRSSASKAFFEARRRGFQVAYFLGKPELTADDCKTIADRLIKSAKFIPTLACLALGLRFKESECLSELTKALPGLDTGVLKKIEALRDARERVLEAAEARALLREAFAFIEDVYERLPR